jgi:hypothetical protein
MANTGDAGGERTVQERESRLTGPCTARPRVRMLATMRRPHRSGGVAARRTARWVGAAVVALALVTARAAWSATREQRVDPFAGDWTPMGRDIGECPPAPRSRTTSEVQVTKPLPVLPEGSAMAWPAVLAHGGRGTSTGAGGAQGQHPGKTSWALRQSSSGAPFTHAAIRTLLQ